MKAIYNTSLYTIRILAVKRCAKSKDKDGRRVEVNTDPLRYESTGAVHQNVSLKETAAEYMAPQPKKQSEYQAIGPRDQPSLYDTMQVDDQPIYEDTFWPIMLEWYDFHNNFDNEWFFL